MRKKRKTTIAFRKEVSELYGCSCINCGSAEGIVYHHIVPLHQGGKDIPRNVVPVCVQCHKAIHGEKEARKYSAGISGGKPCKELTPERERALELYVDGQIGNVKFRELAGHPKGTGFPQKTKYINEWLDNRGIKRVKNNVDTMFVNGKTERIADGVPVGKIEFKDGTTKIVFWKDTGINDVNYIKRIS